MSRQFKWRARTASIADVSHHATRHLRRLCKSGNSVRFPIISFAAPSCTDLGWIDGNAILSLCGTKLHYSAPFAADPRREGENHSERQARFPTRHSPLSILNLHVSILPVQPADFVTYRRIDTLLLFFEKHRHFINTIQYPCVFHDFPKNALFVANSKTIF